ncbi:hypothetical protein BM607_009440 [Shewanella sp. SACH]|uniref:hypothetical protein n=1 Tax=Shewanella sp. SACH TaxID=1873135 RepID=UPI000903C466|nr:hypothetical protein [Shewanella sp. SACH]OUS51470.1 hypothetical protein BM607_009440 [Shewanella sp. SACH]
MGQQLKTDIVLNLAGNLAAKARQYGTSMSDFAKKNDTAMMMVRRSVSAAGRGIDTLGNRYVGAVAAMATGAAAHQFATIDRRLSRLAISADITTDKAKELYEQIRQVSNEKGIRIDPKEALSAVEEILTKTGDLEFAIKNLPNMSAVIQATGASGQNIGGIFTELKKLGISSSEDAMKSIDTLNKQGKSGAFTLASLANYGPQIFAAYAATGRQGTEAVTELGAALQVIREGSGSDAEAVTAFTSIIRDITNPDRVKKLKELGNIDVFDPEKLKSGVEQMRPLSQLMTEITVKSKGLSTNIAQINLTDEAKRALNPLIAAYKQSGDANVFDKFMVITGDGSATLKDAEIAATDLASSFQRINNEVERAGNSAAAGPFKEIADAINGIDQDTIDNWLKWASVAAVAVGTVVAAKKAADVYSWGKNAFGGKGKDGKGGAGGIADMGVMPVYVVNMGAGGMGGAMGADITDAMGGNNKANKSKWSKVGSAAKTGAAALVMYPIIDSIADAIIGDTDFGKWAKATTLSDVFPSIFGEEKIKDVAKPSASFDSKTQTDINSYSRALEGSIDLKLHLTDERSKLTVSKAPPGITVDSDTGIN